MTLEKQSKIIGFICVIFVVELRWRPPLKARKRDAFVNLKIYDRLRPEEKEEPKRVYLSTLAFLQMLPKQFTTAEAVRIGEEYGLKQNGIAKKLAKLGKECYIGKVRHGVYVKMSKAERKQWKNHCTHLAA